MTRRLPIYLTIIFLLAAVPAFSQDSPKPDRWHGLVIDQSTPNDAISTLGKPLKDFIGPFHPMDIESRALTSILKEKAFRHLRWKKLEGMSQVDLAFKDDRLVSITLVLEKGKQFPAASLKAVYNLPFNPSFGTGALGTMNRPRLGPTIFGGPLAGATYQGAFPGMYSLVAETDKAWVTAGVDNASGIREALLGAGDTSQAAGAFPGKIEYLSLLSRTLENKGSGDLLK
jgi:hypothetical protein